MGFEVVFAIITNKDKFQKAKNLPLFSRVSLRRTLKALKLIPAAVLGRCEWGKDDYSLKVENLPKAPAKPGQASLFDLDTESS